MEKEPRLSFKIYGRTTIHLLRAGINAIDNIECYVGFAFISYAIGAGPCQTAPFIFGRVIFSSFSMKDLSAVVRTAHKQMIPAPIWHGRDDQIVGSSTSSPKARVKIKALFNPY